MKGVHFLIGITLFVVCGVLFLREYGHYYEGFDGTSPVAPTCPAGTTFRAGSGTCVGTAGVPVPPICPAGTNFNPPTNMCVAGASPPSSNYFMQGSSGTAGTAGSGTGTAGTGAPATTTTTTMATTSGQTGSTSNQTPGATTANPAASLASAADMQGYITALYTFGSTVNQKGGNAKIVAVLSNDDASYYSTKYAELGRISLYTTTPSAFPYSSSQAVQKTQELNFINQYIGTLNLDTITPGTTTMRTYVQSKIVGPSTTTTATFSAPGVQAGTAGTLNSNGTPNTNPTDLSSQYTSNGVPISTLLSGVVTDSSTPFASSKKDTDQLDVMDLDNLITRIGKIKVQMQTLNSQEPVIVARIQNLDKLVLDLREIKTRGQRNPNADIPITAGDARKFLAATTQLETQLPQLMGIASPARPTQDSSLKPENLMNMAKYLKWSVNVSFDTDLYAREQMGQRVDKILAMLQSQQISSADAQKTLETLTAIQSRIKPGNYKQENVFKSTQADSGFDPSAGQQFQNGYLPDPDQLARITDGGFKEVRPGSNSSATSNSYLTRATSAYAAYNYADSAGPDYKERLINLCAQITKTNLGTGEDLGCMKDMQNAGTDYGWKGAYSMVCNRLQDTWGGSYALQFGCPPNDPTNRFRGH